MTYSYYVLNITSETASHFFKDLLWNKVCLNLIVDVISQKQFLNFIAALKAINKRMRKVLGRVSKKNFVFRMIQNKNIEVPSSYSKDFQ